MILIKKIPLICIFALALSGCSTLTTQGRQGTLDSPYNLESNETNSVLINASEGTSIWAVDDKRIAGIINMMVKQGHEAIKVNAGRHRISAQNAVSFNVSLEFIAGHTYTIHTYIYSNRQYHWVEDNTTNEVVYGKNMGATKK